MDSDLAWGRMLRIMGGAALISITGLAPLHSADIEGNITVTHRLTKAKVTSTADSYERGVAVKLQADEAPDVIAFERSHVVIYLEGQHPSEPQTAVMEQKNRRFDPDLVVLPAGSTVSFPNLDPIFHNVFSLSKAKDFDLGNYPKGHTRTVTFSKPGMVYVNCHLHSNMAAVIVVTPNQWSTRADDAGRFRLAGVPPGDYTIVAWHKAAGFLRRQIKVTADRNTVVNFTVPLGIKTSAEAIARR